MRVNSLLPITFAMTMVMMTGCGNKTQSVSKSVGKPYEVLVVDDSDSTMTNILSSDMVALPQPEPMFDVNTARKTSLDNTQKKSRNIIFVNVDSNNSSKKSIKSKKDVYANGQLIIYINVASASDIVVNKDIIINAIVRHEMEREKAELEKKHNSKAEKEITKMFGGNMLIPSELQSMKKTGANFLWLSNINATGTAYIENVCLYRAKKICTTSSDFIALHDSVMKANIKGENDTIYVKTVEGSCHFDRSDNNKIVVRGLWQMEGDAMGGPFVAYVHHENGATTIAECLIYAPDMKKRNITRRLEACINTFN